jgi:tetratricopeptide (TPR) repeat protein
MQLRSLIALACTLAMAGCAPWKKGELGSKPLPTEEKQPAAGAFQVRVDGSSLTFHAPQVAASKSRTFLPRIAQLLREEDQAAARSLVYRYPELALDCLRSALAQDSADQATLFVAETYDRWLALPTAQAWAPLLSARQRPAAVGQFAQARAQLLEGITNGAGGTTSAAQVEQAAAASGLALLRLEAARTAATAHLVALRPQQAAQSLQQAEQTFGRLDPYQNSQLLLLLSDALRRGGRATDADDAWRRAVTTAALLAQAQPPLFDPAFWETASYLRPVSQEWPAEAAERMNRLTPWPADPAQKLSATEREGVIWGVIGQSLLDRGDHEAALVALKRAESSLQTPELQGWVRIAQSNALARVGQVSASTAILAGLLSSRSRNLTAGASAALGSQKVQGGDLETGHRLLKQALSSGDLEGWIGLADAESDLGLACLAKGEEVTGLRWLRTARNRYESLGEATRVKQSLENELAYWKFRKEPAQTKSVELQLAALETDANRVGAAPTLIPR